MLNLITPDDPQQHEHAIRILSAINKDAYQLTQRMVKNPIYFRKAANKGDHDKSNLCLLRARNMVLFTGSTYPSIYEHTKFQVNNKYKNKNHEIAIDR